MKCPACAAHNPEDASWCTQCYTRFGAPSPPPEPDRVIPVAQPLRPTAPSPADPATPARAIDAGLFGAAPGTPSATSLGGLPPEPAPTEPRPEPQVLSERATSAGKFRTTDQGMDWSCQVCGEWNPLEIARCVVCKTPFAASATHGKRDARPKPVDLNLALIASGVLPGAGHYLMGYVAEGVSRAIAYVFCLVGGLLLLGEASRAGQSTLPGVMLLLGAVIIFAGTLFDTLLALSDRVEDQLLTGRRFFYLIIALLGLLMFSFVIAAVGVRGAGTTDPGTEGTTTTTGGGAPVPVTPTTSPTAPTAPLPVLPTVPGPTSETSPEATTEPSPAALPLSG